MTELQKTMYANYRCPLVNWKAIALVALGFALYPALTLFPYPFFRHQARVEKPPLYDSRLQHQVPICDETWLFLQRTAISHEIVQTLELHRLGSCGGAPLAARNRKDYTDYVSRDPGFVLPEQFPAYRGTTPQQILTGRNPEITIGRDLKAMPSE